MSRKTKIIIGLVALMVLVLVLLLMLLGRQKATPTASPQSSVTPSAKARGLSDAKFPPHPRPQAAANIDGGIKTVSLPGSAASPSPSVKPVARVELAAEVVPLVPASPDVFATPPPSPSPSPQVTIPTAPPTPPPVVTPPTFAPLAPPPAPQGKELVIFYAKGAEGKRQLYARSVEREKDDQIVSSVYDDFGVAFSGAQQKVAFYSNEEGPSDTSKGRTKLKVVDLTTGKYVTLMGGLPGTWPVAWSPDGTKLAIPTANSILIADVTKGTSLQVPTGKNPGGIVWAPGSLKFYFQAEASQDNNDIYEADATAAQVRPMAKTPQNEWNVMPSDDGSKVSFLRSQEGGGNAAVVVKSVAAGDEKIYSESQGADSYLWNLNFSDLVFVKGANKSKLSHYQEKKTQDVEGLDGMVLISFDRDYEHVFVIANDDQGKALFSIDVKTGAAEKIKAGISENTPPLR